MDDDLAGGVDDHFTHRDDNDVDERHQHNHNEAPQGCMAANRKVVKHGG